MKNSSNRAEQWMILKQRLTSGKNEQEREEGMEKRKGEKWLLGPVVGGVAGEQKEHERLPR